MDPVNPMHPANPVNMLSPTAQVMFSCEVTAALRASMKAHKPHSILHKTAKAMLASFWVSMGELFPWFSEEQEESWKKSVGDEVKGTTKVETSSASTEAEW